IPVGAASLILRAFPRERMPLLTVLMVLPIGALFLAASRGGLVAFFVEIGLILILTFLLRGGQSAAVAGAVVLLLAVSLGAWVGVAGGLAGCGAGARPLRRLSEA